MNTDIHMSGLVVKNHSCPNMGKLILCSTQHFVPLVVPGLSTGSSSSSASSSSTSLPQGTSDDSSSSPTARSDSTRIPASGNWSRDPTEAKTQKKRHLSGIGKPIERSPRLVRGVHRKSGRRRSVSSKGHTRKQFSRFRFGTSYSSGIKEAQCSCSLPKRQKLRDLQENQDCEGSLCFKQTNSVTGCSRSQSSQWRGWISKQTQIRCRGTRFSHSMDTVLSVKNENFSGNGKEFTKVNRAVDKLRVYTDNSLEIIMESLCINSTSIPDKWHSWKSGTQNEKGTSAVLLQSGLDEKWWADSVDCCCYLRNVPRLFGRWEILYERRIGEPFKAWSLGLALRLNITKFLRKTSQGSINLVT